MIMYNNNDTKEVILVENDLFLCYTTKKRNRKICVNRQLR